VVARGGAVGDGEGEVEVLLYVVHRLLEPGFVVARRIPRTEAPEHVGRRDDVAEGGELLGDGVDERPDAEDLREQQDAGAGTGRGHPEVEVERPIGDGDLDERAIWAR
jgi:hypothetical protein